jgi:uncharacterized protein (UPF0262 family)
MTEHRLAGVTVDPASLASASAEVEQEREVAIADLLELNHFQPAGGEGGPYHLRLAREDNRLILEVTGPDYSRAHGLSLTPFRGIIKDYFMVCDSYFEAVRSSPQQIEALDMGRRGLHNEGSELLRERLAGKIDCDLDTARRLFTLICALHRRTAL